MAQKRQKQYDTDTIEPRKKGEKDTCNLDIYLKIETDKKKKEKNFKHKNC